MKKTTIASIITTAVAFCLFVASMFFIQWDRQNLDATPSNIVTSVIAYCAFIVTFILFSIIFKNKNKMLIIIPTIGLFIITIVFTNGLINLFNNANSQLSIINLVSPTSQSVFSLLLAISFVVCAVMYLLKGYKWAAAVVVAYLSIIFITTFCYTSQTIFAGDNMLYLFSSLGALVTIAGILIYFTEPFIPECEVKEETKVEAKEEKTEAPVVEETKAEEKTEAPVEEEKTEAPVVEETKAEDDEEASTDDEDEKKKEPQDPFKNQYASTTTVFDVQEENK